MNELKVKDITTHSQHDKERKPRAIELEAFGIKFKVHRHIYVPNTWLLTCYDLKIDNEDMKTDNLNEAIHNARVLMVGYLDSMIIQFQNAIRILNESEEIKL